MRWPLAEIDVARPGLRAPRAGLEEHVALLAFGAFRDRPAGLLADLNGIYWSGRPIGGGGSNLTAPTVLFWKIHQTPCVI